MKKVMGNVKENVAKNKEYLWFLIIITIIMVSVLLIIQNVFKKSDTNNATYTLSEKEESIMEENDISFYSSIVEDITAANATSVTNEEKKEEVPVDKGWILPVSGVIIKGYSPNEPIYSKTLLDYRSHNGVDIKGESGDKVLAVADGIVINAYEDFYWGFVIEIEHKDKIISKYMSVSTDEMVYVGKEVLQGDIISGVGDTALIEIGDEYHLHFEMTKDGKSVDPTTIITSMTE